MREGGDGIGGLLLMAKRVYHNHWYKTKVQSSKAQG